MVIISGLAVVCIVLGAYLIKGPKKKEIFDHYELLGVLYNNSDIEDETICIMKSKIVEVLDVAPSQINSALKYLINSKMILDVDDRIIITQFGADYYNNILNKIKK